MFNMGTMTINISDDTEQLFRSTVKEEVGEGKGKLGEAVDEALKKWAEEKRQIEIGQELLALSQRGFNMGKILIKHRSELYDR